MSRTEYFREYMRDRRKRLKAKGLCIQCKKESINTLCPDCMKQQIIRNKRWMKNVAEV
jgi:predicted RNA-binding Zn-ribbon protein involved in translation (DUF1610 family)